MRARADNYSCSRAVLLQRGVRAGHAQLVHHPVVLGLGGDHQRRLAALIREVHLGLGVGVHIETRMPPSALAPNLPNKTIPTKICRLTISRKSLIDMGIPPLEIKMLLESNPLKSRILVQRLATRSASRHLRILPRSPASPPRLPPQGPEVVI